MIQYFIVSLLPTWTNSKHVGRIRDRSYIHFKINKIYIGDRFGLLKWSRRKELDHARDQLMDIVNSNDVNYICRMRTNQDCKSKMGCEYFKVILLHICDIFFFSCYIKILFYNSYSDETVDYAYRFLYSVLKY